MSDILCNSYAQKYVPALKSIGADEVDDLGFLLPEDYIEAGLKRVHIRKIIKAVSDGSKVSTLSLEMKNDNLVEKAEFSEENEKTLKKHMKSFSNFVSKKWIEELAAFVQGGTDSGITFAALEIVHEEVDFIKQLLEKSEKPFNDAFLSHVQAESGDLCHLLYLELTRIGFKIGMI